jgi:NTE family protein
LSEPKIEAYAILSGGGVKGAALAGALDAAEKLGIEFIGYGGASAGSLVALLASLGYSTQELKELVVRTDFAEFLDDSGRLLKRLNEVLLQAETLMGLCNAVFKSWRWRVWHRMRKHYGLYNGNKLSTFVEEKIRERIPAFRDLHAVTFSHLTDHGCKPLKVIATDIQGRKPIIYSSSKYPSSEVNDQVSHAIRASVGFPFVFQPVTHLGRYLVDGGLSSNLPVALFNEEHNWGGVPVIAFDLQTSNEKAESNGIRSYCSDLMATALEAGDVLYRSFHNIHYVPLQVPTDIGTLDFFLTTKQREQLWEAGSRQAHETLDRAFRNLKQAKGPLQGYQAALNLPPAYLDSPLGALVAEVGKLTPAEDVHAYLFLRDKRGGLVLAHYHDGAASATPSVRLQPKGRWPMCLAFVSKKPQAADLAAWLANNPHLEEPQFAGFLASRGASLSVPIFELGEKAALAQSAQEIPVQGVLMIDSQTSLDVAQWIDTDTKDRLVEMTSRWAGVLARILR